MKSTDELGNFSISKIISRLLFIQPLARRSLTVTRYYFQTDRFENAGSSREKRGGKTTKCARHTGSSRRKERARVILSEVEEGGGEETSLSMLFTR